MHRKATNTVFLVFSIIVAFSNCIKADYIYLAFIFPFFLAQITKGKLSRSFETVGLVFVAIYVLLFQELFVGILILVVVSCLFFTIPKTKVYDFIYCGIITVFVFIVSYFRAVTGLTPFVHAFLNAGLYFVCTASIYVWTYQQVKYFSCREKPLDEKYIALIEELSTVAKESIETLKHIRESEND